LAEQLPVEDPGLPLRLEAEAAVELLAQLLEALGDRFAQTEHRLRLHRQTVGALVKRIHGERLLGGGKCAGGIPCVEPEVAELLEPVDDGAAQTANLSCRPRIVAAGERLPAHERERLLEKLVALRFLGGVRLRKQRLEDVDVDSERVAVELVPRV